MVFYFLNIIQCIKIITMVVVIIEVFMVVYVFNQKELCFLGASLRQYFLVTIVKLCWPKPAPLSPPCIDPQCGISMKLEVIVDLKN